MTDQARNSSHIYQTVSCVAGEVGMCAGQAYMEPPLAIPGSDVTAVPSPVAVPPPESCRVVDSDGIDTAGFK